MRWDGGRPQGSPLRRARWCGGTAGDRKGRPYGGHGGAMGRRATTRVAPTEGTVVRWDGGRPQGSPLRRARWCSGAGDRKGRPYEGECTPLKCLAEFAARRRQKIRIISHRDMCVGKNTSQAASVEFCRLRQNYARGRPGTFWRKNRRFFARDDKRAVPDRDSPFESVKRVYCAALAALMDSISSGTTLNRSPTIP